MTKHVYNGLLTWLLGTGVCCLCEAVKPGIDDWISALWISAGVVAFMIYHSMRGGAL